ncbi:MAG: LON peptidase substrate-binding domain-containing protein [Candidatus Sericytochromatia bacterium]
MPDRIIPIFPLNLVLFPGMVLPLRIFEPRYQLMVRRLLADDRKFGVALIAAGEEVGEAATPCRVGTIAEISSVEAAPDGQLMLLCVGLRRFRIEEMIEGEPYAQAAITILEEGDPAEPVDETLLSACVEGLEGYIEALTRITNLSISVPTDELSPIDLSYLMAALLQVENDQKQALLEVEDAEARLHEGLELLKEERSDIDTFLAQSRAMGDTYYRGHRISLN